MDNICLKSIRLAKNILNDANVRKIDFYQSVLLSISSVFKNTSLALFFLENCEYILKSAVKDSKTYKKEIKLNNIEIQDFLDSKNSIAYLKLTDDIFFDSKNIIIKLAIKESVFGFCILTSNDAITPEFIDCFSYVMEIVSYKIKDFELSEVFKLQLKTIQDAIVEKQEALDIVKKQNKKLLELDKTKGMFLASISHELRTPLNAIIGFSQALDSQIFGELNEKQSEYIKDIQVSGLHLLGMINEILDMSKLEANAMKFSPIKISPNQIISDVVNILEPLYKRKNIEIQLDLKFDGFINADHQKFQQILYNLLSNSIKFSSEKGKIKISSYHVDKNYILIVQDNGIGIDKKNHSKVFKKFVHLNNVYIKNQNSTGLGLAITKELVKLHNGKITLESELNKGAKFTMEFKNIVL